MGTCNSSIHNAATVTNPTGKVSGSIKLPHSTQPTKQKAIKGAAKCGASNPATMTGLKGKKA